MLVENVKLLTACKLDLIGTAMCLGTFYSGSMLIHSSDLALGERTRVVLMQAVVRCLAFVKYSIVRV